MPPSVDTPANVSRFSFEASALPADTFRVMSFEGTEGLSELFKFTIRLSSKDADLNLAQVVGRPATLTVDRAGEAVPTAGLVTDLRQTGRSGAGEGYPYLDEEGRSGRARLHFGGRSGRAQGTATLPIRMAQPSSGPDAVKAPRVTVA